MDNKSAEKKELISLIQNELANIDVLNREAYEYDNEKNGYRRAIGSVIHDFYNACEHIFELIARRINGGIHESEHWHKRLLHEMTVNINDVRPAVISKRLAAELLEYLEFRHVFRHIYGFELEGDRLDDLLVKLDKTVKLFKKEIRAFIKKL